MRQYMIFNWVAMITYSVKLLMLGKATRAPYKRAPASELSFCCRSGRAQARPVLIVLCYLSFKRVGNLFYLFNKASVSEPYIQVSCYLLFREVSSLLFIIRVLCYSLLKRVSVYLLLYGERAKRAYIFFVIFLFKKVSCILLYILYVNSKQALASDYISI